MASPSLNPESTLSAGWEAAPAQVKSSSSEGTSSVQSFDSTSTSATEPEETSDPKRAAQAGENSLSEDPFDSPASRALFDAIDQLHSCNVSKYIEEMRVPQVSSNETHRDSKFKCLLFVKLVIVGGQSVGKYLYFRV